MMLNVLSCFNFVFVLGCLKFYGYVSAVLYCVFLLVMLCCYLLVCSSDVLHSVCMILFVVFMFCCQVVL